MEKWLYNMRTILLKPKYPQTKGALEKIEDGVTMKCALGEIRCQAKVKTNDITDSRGEIMKAVGVPEEFYNGKLLPAFKVFYDHTIKTHVVDGFDFYDEVNIQYWIYTLNDGGFTYPEIMEFLETTFSDPNTIVVD